MFTMLSSKGDLERGDLSLEVGDVSLEFRSTPNFLALLRVQR